MSESTIETVFDQVNQQVDQPIESDESSEEVISDSEWTVITDKKKPRGKKPRNKPSGPVSESYDQVNYPNFGDQDWKPVVIQRRSGPPKKVVQARATRPTDTARHFTKIDQETENFQHKTVKPELCQKIASYRREHNLTQVELARMINEKPDVVNSYENGTAVPDPNIVSKFYRVFKRAPPAKPPGL